MKIKCRKCGDIITGELGKFIHCSCNSVFIDVCDVLENGREICRVGGNPEDIEYVKD